MSCTTTEWSPEDGGQQHNVLVWCVRECISVSACVCVFRLECVCLHVFLCVFVYAEVLYTHSEVVYVYVHVHAYVSKYANVPECMSLTRC